MSINSLIKLISALIFTSLYSCECVSGPNHTFEQQASFAPEQLEYKVGDTIWLSSSFSCKGLLNTSTGEAEDFCVKEISLSLQLLLLEPSPQDSLAPIPAVQYFDFINTNGYVSQGTNVAVSAYFQTEDDEYHLKIGIIPRKSGKFLSSVSGGGPYSLPHAKKCDTGSFYFSPDVQDNHISLLADFKKGIEKVTDYEKVQCYCFEVK